jgi:hypothetical protein
MPYIPDINTAIFPNNNPGVVDWEDRHFADYHLKLFPSGVTFEMKVTKAKAGHPIDSTDHPVYVYLCDIFPSLKIDIRTKQYSESEHAFLESIGKNARNYKGYFLLMDYMDSIKYRLMYSE